MCKAVSIDLMISFNAVTLISPSNLADERVFKVLFTSGGFLNDQTYGSPYHLVSLFSPNSLYSGTAHNFSSSSVLVTKGIVKEG